MIDDASSKDRRDFQRDSKSSYIIHYGLSSKSLDLGGIACSPSVRGDVFARIFCLSLVNLRIVVSQVRLHYSLLASTFHCGEFLDYDLFGQTFGPL